MMHNKGGGGIELLPKGNRKRDTNLAAPWGEEETRVPPANLLRSTCKTA